VIILIALIPSGFVSPTQARQQGFGPSSITWSRTYQYRFGFDQAWSVLQTSDGGFVVAGHSFVAGGWVFKLDIRGAIEWERTYVPAGYVDSWPVSMDHTKDGGYIIAGYALSETRANGDDAWLLKLDRKGDVQWSQTYGGSGEDFFYSAQQTSDGGYVAAGLTGSFGPGVQYSGETAWVFRLDPNGNVVWDRDYGADEADWVQQTSDGEFIVAGTVAIGNLPTADAWISKLDTGGNTVWQKTFELSTNTRGYSVDQTPDGGYILAADSSFHTSLFIRLDSMGNVLWQRSLSGMHTEFVRTVSDGGFIIVGREVKGPFLLRLDSTGDMVWRKTYGRPGSFLLWAQENRDGGFVAVGTTLGAAWVLKLDGTGNIPGCSLVGFSNATVTDSSTTSVNATITGVSVNPSVTQTSVNVANTQADVQIQCQVRQGFGS
jgi:hypothetical protein